MKRNSLFFRALLFLDLEFVADAPYGFQSPLVRNALKLFAQTLYMNVNGSRISVVVEAPDLVEKLVSRKDPVGIAREVVDKLHLLGGSVDLFAVYAKLVICQVDRELVVMNFLDRVFVGSGGTAKNRLDSRDDLLDLERLDNIIVRAELEPENLVNGLALCGEHDDRA